MKRVGPLLVGLLIASSSLLCVVFGRSLAGDADAKPKPVTLDASKFPTLQAALDALPESGGVVVLPPGEFELKEPLVLARGDTRIVGAGGATRLINRNEEGQPALLIKPAGWPKNRKARLWRVQIAHFRISGNPKSGDGVRAEAIEEIYIHGLDVDHHGGHGINFVECHENPRVAQCN
ncbi:MAG: hypothetical protein N2689_16960, partial [Verrucomicrobiae bacterium]|nr:hypothetical protein [Verrucomicrobiae bacterium]